MSLLVKRSRDGKKERLIHYGRSFYGFPNSFLEFNKEKSPRYNLGHLLCFLLTANWLFQENSIIMSTIII